MHLCGDWQEIRGRCNGTCEVTVESRSYCKRCRLRKCFTVGMKRELILSKSDDWPVGVLSLAIILREFRRIMGETVIHIPVHALHSIFLF